MATSYDFLVWRKSVSDSSGGWRSGFSTVLIGAGVLIMIVTGAVWLQSRLVEWSQADERYLSTTPEASLALPQLTPTVTPLPLAAPTPTPMPPVEPVVRLQIPRLKVDRAVIPIGMRPDKNGSLVWDTDALFANRSRPDLVGQLVGSANPGQNGNVILTGHNYNQGRYNWKGVFVNLQGLQPGDEILVDVQGGDQYAYLVESVNQVPWREKSEAEWARHVQFLGASDREQLTLVTCGGAAFYPFPNRVYVVAHLKPETVS